ncbi:MAG: SRPBCC domain-containing protein [Bacteroidetes bacterium]|nr:SRPBCC domain-containing protein [Bacteroidota bacterium]
MIKDTSTVVVEQVFGNSVTQVWQAITQLDQMKQWFFENIPEFKPEVGFKTQFNVNAGERNFLHLWRILEVVPEKSIVYDWRYKEYPGQGIVKFELSETGGQTKLKLTNEGLESFPDHIPEFTHESCHAGWNYFIKEQLKAFLEGK